MSGSGERYPIVSDPKKVHASELFSGIASLFAIKSLMERNFAPEMEEFKLSAISDGCSVGRLKMHPMEK